MSAFLVIERPDHSPRVLGAFDSRRDAERARRAMVAEAPRWGPFVSIRTSRRDVADDQRSPWTFVSGWLVVLIVVDVVVIYALYLAARAMLGLV
jgi:hypothetical protein